MERGRRGKRIAAGVAALLASALGLGAVSTRAGGPPETERATRGIAKLGWGLVRAAGDGNVVVSPLSVWEALAMTQAGARGPTASEIAAVLGMPDDPVVIGTAAESLRAALVAAKGEKIALDVANRLWVQRGKRIEASFATLLAERFGAAAGEVDFAGATEAARQEINHWVAERTADKIDELLARGVVTPLSRVVLTNAVYLKAPWSKPFAESATRPAPFSLTPGESIEVPFMNRTGRMTAGKVEGATVVEIPYAGERMAMIVAVPDAADGVDALVARLGADGQESWDASLRRRPVVLSLPRFTARQPLSLNDALAGMGMKAAFAQQSADFSGIDGTKELYVSAVVHEGFVEVTEEGTEAAAATGVVVAARSQAVRQEEPLIVKADRPFVWAIVERASGALLFAGVLRDPRG